MTSELLSLASSRPEFAFSEMNQYLSRQYEEKELYELLKPHFYDLELFCDSYNCKKLVKHALPVDESILLVPAYLYNERCRVFDQSRARI